MAELNSFATKSEKEVLLRLNTSINGLHDAEAKKRQLSYGKNIISEKKEFPIIIEFLKHFANPLILLLIIAAGVSAMLGEHTDSVIIGIIVLFGVILDFIQEYQADKALKKLLDAVKTTATVIRNGAKKEIHISEIVPGDIICISSGNMIPADARLIESKDFFINQSAITGESYPCEKTPGAITQDIKSATDLQNIVFCGTNVVSGSATAVVINTGKETEFGKISSKLSVADQKSEFEIGINNFGIFIMKLTFFLLIFIFLFNSIIRQNMFQSLMFAIAIAVGVTPELLPMIMSITMTAGSKKMAKMDVIVKKLSALPNFGSMNILCTDKTGTLTENKIHLIKYTDFQGNNDKNIFLYAYLNSINQTGIKNAMDDAVISYEKPDTSGFKKIDEIPYDFERKRMSVVVRHKNKNIMITKGAPEEIFRISDFCIKGNKKTAFKKDIHAKAIGVYNKMSSDGYRVLAVAVKDLTPKKVYSKHDENSMSLLGFIAFLDPPKSDAREVIAEIGNLGIEIKVITGDNEFVTKRICDQVGLNVKGILLGMESEKLTDAALKIRAENTTIFARFSPIEKERIISLLKSEKNVVGYLGDGINDAPSLKTADVGISVSTAVDVAKESADIVLTRKSLHILKSGILEGRKTFGNTMKYIMMALSSNIGNMFSAAGAVLFLPFLPMLPIQILLNNLIYDFSQISIPSDNVDEEWIRKPKRWNLKFIKKFLYVFGPVSSLFDYITFFILFLAIKASAPVFQTAWFMESLATQILVIHVVRTKSSPFKSRASKFLMITTIACVAIGWIIPYTELGRFFGFVPLPLKTIFILIGIVLAYLITAQIAKTQFYRFNDF